MKRKIIPTSSFVLLNDKGQRVKLHHRVEIPMYIDIYQTKNGIADFRYYGSYEGEDDWYMGYADVSKLKYVISIHELSPNEQTFINYLARLEGIDGPYLNVNILAGINHPCVYSIFEHIKKAKFPHSSKIHIALRT